MTDRERKEKTLAKVRQKHPDVVNQDELLNLAIQHDKKFSLLMCLGFLLAAIVCFVLALITNESHSETRTILIITGVGAIVQIFRTLGKHSKIEKLYRPTEIVVHQGVLTQERIL